MGFSSLDLSVVCHPRYGASGYYPGATHDLTQHVRLVWTHSRPCFSRLKKSAQRNGASAQACDIRLTARTAAKGAVSRSSLDAARSEVDHPKQATPRLPIGNSAPQPSTPGPANRPRASRARVRRARPPTGREVNLPGTREDRIDLSRLRTANGLDKGQDRLRPF